MELADIIRQSDCSLCQESLLEIGGVSNYGAAIIAKIGSLEDGWYATLQRKTPADPQTGFSVHIMPQGHLTSFGQIKTNPRLTLNYGLIFSSIYQAIEEIIREQSGLAQLGCYGKCGTSQNTKEHIHFKLFEESGGLNQPWPSDNPWSEKEVYITAKGDRVLALPVKKSILSQERVDYLSRRLIYLLNDN